MEARPRELELYATEDGKKPFAAWLEAIPDAKTKAQIYKRLARVRLGNLGDHRMVGGGVAELRLDFGPGYRIYYGEVERRLVLLLCGGDKRSQTADIETAKTYWNDYERRTR